MFGWRGRLLRVNLTNGVIDREALAPEDARDYLGGRGLGIYLHAKNVPASTAPTDPENHLIFTTGPLTGTLAPNGGRYTVVTRASAAGALMAASISGKWGPGLKSAGFDGIIFEGRAAEPAYLWVNDGAAELRPAAHAKGKPVAETTDLLLKETDAKALVSCIGPAGENGLDCSVIVSDGFSAAGRGGAGAVMGSKNLKAVVVCGTEGFRVADHSRFLKCAMELRSFMKVRAIALKGAWEHGPVLKADSLEWVPERKDSRAARTRGCFGCATSFSSFSSGDGRVLPLLAGSPSAEISERLSEYRQFVNWGLDYAAAKTILAASGNGRDGSFAEMARKLASGDPLGQKDGEDTLSAPIIDRGPCIADGYAIAPRIPAADGPDEAASDLMAILDSTGLCPFLYAGISMDLISELLGAATGIQFSRQEILQVAQRISQSVRWTA